MKKRSCLWQIAPGGGSDPQYHARLDSILETHQRKYKLASGYATEDAIFAWL